MATRFYWSSSAVPDVAPSFAAWDRTTEALRRVMDPTADGSTMVASSTFGGVSQAANGNGLWRQFVGKPLAAGNAFSVSDTVKGVVLAREDGTVDDNVNRQPITLKVVSMDGTTLRATLLTLAHYGPSTTEWNDTTATSRQLAVDATLTGGYTTVAGDRLVLEVGAQVDATGGTNVFASFVSGSADGTDLDESEVDTTGRPWFEVSRTLTFFTPPDDAGGCLLTILRRF